MVSFREAAATMRGLHQFLASGTTRDAIGPVEAMRQALWRWHANWGLDERERYLSASTDHADFERRLLAWERYELSRARFPRVD
jgi:hypothetical protein